MSRTAIYAAGGRKLLEMRQQGYQVQGPVIVTSTVDYWDVPTLRVYADMAVDRIDWRMLVNLDVWLWVTPATALDRVTQLALAIAKGRPKTLFVRMESGDRTHDVQVGDGWHLPKILPEFPAKHEFSVCITNNSGTRVGQMLRAALMTKFHGLETL